MKYAENLSNLTTICNDDEWYNAEARAFARKYVKSIENARDSDSNPIEMIEDDLYEEDEEFSVTNPLAFAYKVQELINDEVADESDETFITDEDVADYIERQWKLLEIRKNFEQRMMNGAIKQ